MPAKSEDTARSPETKTCPPSGLKRMSELDPRTVAIRAAVASFHILMAVPEPAGPSTDRIASLGIPDISISSVAGLIAGSGLAGEIKFLIESITRATMPSDDELAPKTCG